MNKLKIIPLIAFTSFNLCAQNVKVDLKDILLERRDEISPNYINVLNDGTILFKAKEHYYKFDLNGKLIGSPEKNGSGNVKYNPEASSILDTENDLLLYFNGKDQLTITKFHGDRPNEYSTIPFPKLKDVSDAGSPAYSSVKMINEKEIIILEAYNGRSNVTHSAIAMDKNKVDYFLRAVKINTETKEVIESFKFINKLNVGKKDFNTIDVRSVNVVNGKIVVGVLICNSVKADEYNPYYRKIDGSYELWEVDLDSDEEKMIQSIPIKTPVNTRSCLLSCNESGYLMNWTESVEKENYFGLCTKYVLYEKGELKESVKKFPTDVLALRFPGNPIDIEYDKAKNGEYSYRIVGNVGKGPLDNNPTQRVFLFGENDEVTITDVKSGAELKYWKNGKEINYSESHNISPDFIASLEAPLLKKSAMNYLYKGNYYTLRGVNDELIIVHCDWRATLAKPDCIFEIIRLPL
ncbi:hypothetical protein [uncultured Fluviicola sp.]|uniref:hypothetical protein n=1 Tax=uncultured Fluviicola sp. TaxID=463303 RepID=UPI0025EBDA4A|nr:hypothetical protein [uncultured Fluviicola sp.]